ncbi:MAG: histone deacetylase family protein [Dehalococcoidia bacterium]|nr:MAG: histone deacetylase family protein [Dehalococcoidia bacterium]
MVSILYREELREYDFGVGHPFRGDRYEIFPKVLKEHVVADGHYRLLAAETCTEEDLRLICGQEYIDFSRDYFRAANLGETYSRSMDFPKFHSLDNLPRGRPGKLEEAARMIIGQAKKAAELVMEHGEEIVICIGGNLHHAKPDYGEGFCIYNDNAFAAKRLLQQYGLQRIMVLDTDAHQGNGTCEYFYSDPRVLFVDLHQDPTTLYPGVGFANDIGEGEGKGFTINVPMPVYAGLDSYRIAFDEIVTPVAREFKPQVIIRNGGSDPHFADGLANLGLPVAGFRMIGEKMRQLTHECGCCEIDIIGSGYNIEVLPASWLALVSGVAGFGIDIEEPVPIPQRFAQDLVADDTEKIVQRVRGYLKDYWTCFR